MKKLVIVALILYILWVVGGQALVSYADQVHDNALESVCKQLKGVWDNGSCYITYFRQSSL